jgi:anaerobic magnesium-protoporphyrin IX monomethyl ester cyclase
MKLLLTTLHAKYSHASLALPCLAASCRDIIGITTIIKELTVNEPHEKLLRQLVSHHADLIAFSCYIWNIEATLKLVSDIKKIAPETITVLGGPEASFGSVELMSAHPALDYVVKGEGEEVFRQLLNELLSGKQSGNIPNLFYRNNGNINSGPMSNTYLALDSIPSPFKDELVDLSKPLIYYETSRGCPFSCAFCLSSVDRQVRSFSEERIKSDLLFLMERNISQIKLVDRTFNYDPSRANRIWQFILQQTSTSHFHFEIAADLLTEENITLLKKVPPNRFRFEIGVQSTSQETLERVYRTADLAKIFTNVSRLRQETSLELHLDLVAGLPGENYDGLLDSLQQVAKLRPDVIQIEPLKLLKGSAMRRIAEIEQYHYSDSPPYTILNTPSLAYDQICRIETIGRLLDLFYNHTGFETALKFMLFELQFAALFDAMADQVIDENLSGYNTRRTYELFARLAKKILPPKKIEALNDALFFDYCMVELPLMGKLPSFIHERQSACTWPGRGALPEQTVLAPGSRSKCFRFTFCVDYRSEEWRKIETTLTFVHISEARQGLKVLIV